MPQDQNIPQPPQWGQPTVTQPAMPPKDPNRRPGWTRKRIIIPVTAAVFVVGIAIGGASSGSSTTTTKTAADAKAAPAPTVTITATATPSAKAPVKAKPAPTVTVTATATKTVKAKAPAAPAKKKPDAAPKDKVVFKVWGSAPSGVDITYGSDSDNIQGHGLPMTKTMSLNDDAMYYDVSAQLSGGGDIHCSVTVGGKTKTGHASGGYNICTAQLSGGIFGGWD
ncbi:MmpS family transport accessory protein [Streptomyces sp. 8L]|uniref:MmpS family transport accessory protein n=1 Tax=Streptomyces sp. 8L TaxID=2877242 RepID=UPI001CD50AED|nr:MmpS family transport accessory protein [Streptomyces sp. 8L]MCA1223328.1 hypothetical protein [Streptomyces sp. 8L]